MNSRAHEQVANALASLFLAASTAASARIVQAGWPLTVPVRKTVVQRNPAKLDNWGGSTLEVQQNILAHHDAPWHQLAPLLPEDVAQAVTQCASNLADLPESNLPFWSTFGYRGGLLPQDYYNSATGLVGWTAIHLLLPALAAHLTALPSLDATSDQAAEAFAGEVLQVATAHELAYMVTVPLAGVDIEASSDVLRASDEVSIRRLSPDEQGMLLESGLNTLTVGNTESLPYVALEMRVSTGLTAQNPDIRETLAKWLCALQLHGFEPAGSMAVTEANPRWVMMGRSYNPVVLPRQPRNWSVVNTAALQKVHITVDWLQQYNVSEPRSEHDLALHRLCTGAARSTSADAVLDFVIALESLLLPYDEVARHSELRYRFHIHGAHYLSEMSEDRKEMAKQLLRLYDLRSGLMHGGRYPAKADVEATRVETEQLTRRGLLRAVTDGFPTQFTFKDMVLGVWEPTER